MSDNNQELKKRGRPKNTESEASNKRERLERLEGSDGARKKRVSMARTSRLGLPSSIEKQEGMHYCWAMMDDKGTIERYLDAYYEFALNKQGKQECRPAGDGRHLVLMKIEYRYYQEDIEKEQERCIASTYESAQLSTGEYVPQGHDAVISRNYNS